MSLPSRDVYLSDPRCILYYSMRPKKVTPCSGRMGTCTGCSCTIIFRTGTVTLSGTVPVHVRVCVRLCPARCTHMFIITYCTGTRSRTCTRTRACTWTCAASLIYNTDTGTVLVLYWYCTP